MICSNLGCSIKKNSAAAYTSIVHIDINGFRLLPGKVVEYDKPMKLMETEGSLFRELVKEYWSYASSRNI
jgi:hypothetical protein